MEQLAAETGTSVDTVRYYQNLGLLPAPEKEGRIAWYGDSHLERVSRIRTLSEEGFTLEQIGRLDDDAVLQVLAGASDPMIDRSTLAERSGLDPGLIDLAIDAGLVPTTESGLFPASAVAMLAGAAAILDSGIDETALLSLAVRHAERIEASVDEAIGLFEDRVGEDRAETATEIERLLPAVLDLVGEHFRQTLLARATERAEK